MLGLWQMTEHPSCDERLWKEVQSLFHHEGRQREYVCVRLLLRAMVGSDLVTIDHLPDGKPFLKGDARAVSISHTRGFCAVLLADESCGIDIEYVSNRVDRIAHRFMRADETATDTLGRLLVWSAKESLFKLCSDDHLTYEQMRITGYEAGIAERPNDVSRPILLTGENLSSGQAFAIRAVLTEKYVLTWCMSK